MRTYQRSPRDQAPGVTWRQWLLPLGAAAGIVALLSVSRGAPPGMTLSYSQFLNDVGADSVRAVTIDPAGQVAGSLATGQPFTTTIPVALDNRALAGQLAAHHVQVTAIAAAPSSPLPVLIGLLLLVLIGGLFYVGVRGARRGTAGVRGLTGIGELTRANTRIIDAERPVTQFADVAGSAAVKTEIGEVVDYLRDPGRYRAAGARGPRGVLMAGPPGTGKTLLARAVAGEAHVPFLSITGSSFVELFVGVGAARVRDLFQQARDRAPAIVFIDEIDALGTRRDAGSPIGSDEREQTLNQLLAEMDGVEPSDGVILLAATNRPDALDSALRRPGRFDREVLVPLPSQADRQAILTVNARDKNLEPDVDLGQVAAATPGFSGADLANLVNEAALAAVRAGRSRLIAADFAGARDRVVLGTRDRSATLTREELTTVAVHEAGHALVAAVSPHADPVSRVTVLGAGQALGLTEQIPADDRRLYGERYLADALAVRLGGRAAELLVRGEASTGAADDLSSATALATQMVREFGLSQAIGPVSYAGTHAWSFSGPGAPRGYSERTQWIWIPAVIVLEWASMAALAGMQRRLLAAGGASVGVRPMLATTFAANALSVSVPLAGPELGAAFTFRRYTAQGADAPLAAWSLAVGGVVSAAAAALLVAGGGLSSGNLPVTAAAVVTGVLAAAALAVAVAAARRAGGASHSKGSSPGCCDMGRGCCADPPRILSG